MYRIYEEPTGLIVVYSALCGPLHEAHIKTCDFIVIQRLQGPCLLVDCPLIVCPLIAGRGLLVVLCEERDQQSRGPRAGR